MAYEEDFNLAGIYTYGDLLRHMQQGLRFCELTTYRDGTKNLWQVLSADGRYIYWRNYGSSANSATAKDMKFVVERIFKTTLPEFLRKYIWVY